MRIYSRKQFLDIPAGVIFNKGKEWYFDGPFVKGDTIQIGGKKTDFWYGRFNWVDGKDTGECIDRLERMLNNGARYSVIDGHQRDGHFDETDLFMVYELSDLIILRDAVDTAIKLEKL